jgi:transcriptional regulator with GAF, ATPase, and Fis domain
MEERMARTTVYLVTDDVDAIEKAKAYFEPQGVTVTAYNSNQWSNGLEQSQFRSQLSAGTPALVTGFGSSDRSNVLPFPGTNNSNMPEQRVTTMEELESKAIESAIMQCRGNLTEAAKALGIGRATLYRKVKHFQIDPSLARKRRAA